MALQVLAAVLVASPALAQDRPRIVPSPPLAPAVDAFPRLEGSGAAVARINESLAALDAAATHYLTCEDFGRSVAVLFRGPDYVSFADASGYFCEGAAHPWWGTSYLTFDLATGTVVGPVDLLPAGTTDEAQWTLFIEHLDPTVGDDCRRVFEDYRAHPLGGMALWLSAEGQALGMAPVLAWVDKSCETEVWVPADSLAVMGFPDRLVRALRQSQP